MKLERIIKNTDRIILKIEIGKRAYKNNRNDYSGETGTIIWCNKCCKANRIQFDNIGNNEALSNFNLLKCKLKK